MSWPVIIRIAHAGSHRARSCTANVGLANDNTYCAMTVHIDNIQHLLLCMLHCPPRGLSLSLN